MNDVQFAAYLKKKAARGLGIHSEGWPICPACMQEISHSTLASDHIGTCNLCGAEFVWLTQEMHGRQVLTTWME